jgi:hypothetical protein
LSRLHHDIIKMNEKLPFKCEKLGV